MKGFIVFLVLIFAAPVFGASVTLTWDAPTTNEDGTPLTDLAGYDVHYGSATQTYSLSVDVGNVTSYTWDVGEREDEVLFFNVRAYDTYGNFSVYNGEISVPFGMVAPNPPINLQGVVVQ